MSQTVGLPEGTPKIHGSSFSQFLNGNLGVWGHPQNPWFIILPISQWQLAPSVFGGSKPIISHEMVGCPPDFWMLKNRFLRFCKDQKKWNPTPLYRNHFSCFKWKFADIFPTEMAGKKKTTHRDLRSCQTPRRCLGLLKSRCFGVRPL